MAITYASYGALVSVRDSIYGSVTIAGRVYKTIKIGNFEILAENLDAEFSGITHGNAIASNNPMCCYFNNGDAYTYGLNGTYGLGLMYNGYAVSYIEANKQTLLPEGWGITTLAFLTLLVSATGYSNITGAKGISKGNLDWAPNWTGNDILSFNAKPGGNWNSHQGFLNFGTGVRFWTTNTSQGFYYNFSQGVFELPTRDLPEFYSYIRLFRRIVDIQ